MRTKNTLLKVGVVLGGLALALQASADTVAYQVPTTLNPAGLNNGSLGAPVNIALEFTVNTPINVTALGAYDATIGHSGTGFAAPVQIGIYSEDNAVLVTPVVTFGSGNSGIALGGGDSSRYQTITAVTLEPGTYQVIASGFAGDGETLGAPYWNVFFTGGTDNPIIFDGDGAGTGALTMEGTFYSTEPGFQTVGSDPGINDDTAHGPYGGPTFTYTAVPEPSASQLALLGAGVFGLIHLGRRARKNRSSASA
jgi:hypothetical protein